ncbi:MAG: competence/damage-inducible protein A [Chloroflexi bacterium]|jgi:nicotinamide-nucleotide amidase|nr:competence/damage-inducible protein A [Chloroflexota bacterium]
MDVMAQAPWVEIVAIGNELLAGDVLDTNSHWLCQQLTGLGARVRQVCLVRDDLEAIAARLGEALARDTCLLITVGGLGPTDDDLTLQGVARALGVAMQVNERALEMVTAKYAELAHQGYVAFPEMTPSRVKMARFPQGGEPLQNNVGAAPGMVWRQGQRTVVSLPGVPGELKDIFQGSLAPVLRDLLGEAHFAQWKATVDCGDESVLAPLLSAVAAAHPEVYTKSRARRFGPDVRFSITLSARGETQAVVRDLLGAAWEDLRARLEKQGIGVISLDQGG